MKTRFVSVCRLKSMRSVTSMKQYCVECDKFVDAIEKHYELTLPVKGEDITITATSPFCEECGSIILIDTIEENNIQLAYDAYREKHGLLKPDEIKGIRARFHLSQHDFSIMLGLGVHTLSRLERGDIISCALNTQIKSIQTKNDLIKLYEINKINLTDSERKRIEKAINASDDAFDSFNYRSRLADYEDDSPSAKNGYRLFDKDRAVSLVIQLATRCNMLSVTKFMKALFYTDFYSHAVTGISFTGLTYARATYGPVVNNRENLISYLKDAHVISTKEIDDAEYIVCAHPKELSFSRSDSEIINDIVLFVNSFPTAQKISEASHELALWKNSENGKLIPYSNTQEVAQQIKRRIAAHN